jgi:hypothetical protein
MVHRYCRVVDEARAVLARLDRIQQLEASGAGAGALLSEVRMLLQEAEIWVRAERGDIRRAAEAIERCRAALSPPIRESADSVRVKPAGSFSAPPDAAPFGA